MFSLNHIVLLCLCAVFVLLGTAISLKLKLSSKRVSLIFFLICCISEIVKDFNNIIPSKFGGFVLDPFDIPLHLCSVVIFAMLYIVLTKNNERREHIKTAVVVIGMIAPILALLIPAEGVNFNKPITYQYFFYHAALFWYALYLTLTKQVTFGLKEYIRNLIYLCITTVTLLYLNSALSVYGVNFCYLRRPPIDGLPILNLDHGWPVYFVTLLLIGVISITIVYLPSIIKEIKNKKTNNTEV